MDRTAYKTQTTPPPPHTQQSFNLPTLRSISCQLHSNCRTFQVISKGRNWKAHILPYLPMHNAISVRIMSRSVDRASRYNRGQTKPLETQLILSIFCEPLHVSRVSRPIIRRYNRMYTTVGTYYSFWMTVCFPGWVGIQPGQYSVIQKE
jgi:hypothetical protein